jgi:hypothetical protein
MRPVNKGAAPNTYTYWGYARNDLANQIGWYCSYCEMSVSQMIEVEHVVARNNGGPPLDWENFLLSCKYCNTVKGTRNPSRTGFLWADKDNTDLAFTYSELDVITPLPTTVEVEAQETIDLMGLDRRPGGANEPTEADSRWIHRFDTWQLARVSLTNWNTTPSPEMAHQIAITAKCQGFYSIWMEVFQAVPDVLEAIKNIFPNTYFEQDAAGARIPRAGGLI